MQDAVNRVHEHLRQLDIPFRALKHEPVTTSAEAAAARDVPLEAGVKSLLICADNNFALLSLAADRSVNWRAVRDLLGTKSVRVANEEELLVKTGLPKGGVPPLGSLYGMQTLLDDSALVSDLVYFNAGTRTDSVEMPSHRLAEAAEAQVCKFSKQSP